MKEVHKTPVEIKIKAMEMIITRSSKSIVFKGNSRRGTCLHKCKTSHCRVHLLFRYMVRDNLNT